MMVLKVLTIFHSACENMIHCVYFDCFTQNIGILKYGRPDPVKYMSSLEKYGFENVRMEYKKDEDTGN